MPLLYACLLFTATLHSCVQLRHRQTDRASVTGSLAVGDRSERGDHPGTFTAGQCSDHRRLSVPRHGQTNQKVLHRLERVGRELRGGTVDAHREVIGVHDDLTRRVSKKSFRRNDQPCHGIRTTSRAAPVANRPETNSSA